MKPMSNSLERLDDAAREAASAPAASILLEAPAGSGKTAVLTRRFLRLLCTVEDPGEILAITFTRKAAADMRARITRALRGELRPAGGPHERELHALAQAALAHGAALGWKIAAEPHSLRIQTIDSFNYWLASQLPVASQAGGVLTVTESPGELYQRAARRTLAAAETDRALAPDAQLLFERCDNRWMSLERLIAEMLRVRGHWLPFVAGQDPQQLCRQVNASLAAIARARLTALHEVIPEALRRRAQSLPGAGPLGADPLDLAHWKRLARLALGKDGWRKQVSIRQGPEFADPATRERLRELIGDLSRLTGLREALADLRSAPAAQLSADETAAIVALARMLSRAAAELRLEFAHSGRVDYTYITGAAREALIAGGEPTDLALRTGLKLRHVLVDEFQDTSLAQCQLLETLTAGWEEGDGRTLFLVGDPMQSIYRFRDAEVGLFLRARDRGIGQVHLKPLRLARNFRAVPELVAFGNELFAQILPPGDDLRTGAVSCRVSTPARAGAAPLAGIEPVSLRLFPGDPHAEARAIALRAADLRRLDPQGGVAVLVAAHAHAVPVIAALEMQGVPVLGVDLVPLRERMVVRDLVQLVRALYDLADRAAWLAVLRAPWCGARLATLTALSGLNDPELIIEALGNSARLGRCDPADLPRLARVRTVMSRALAERSLDPVTDWVERTWMRLGACDAYRAEELGDARAFFAALAERATAHEWRGPEDIRALLENLYSTPPAGENPVQVMTIHRAKGLEFDHLIVPALERTTRGTERRLLRWIDLPGEGHPSDLLIAPTPAVGPGEASELDLYLRTLERQRDAHERRRLMYVAVTRAQRTLWLSAAPAMSDDGTVKADPRSPLAILWPALGQRFARVATAPPLAGMPARTAPLLRLRPQWQPAPPPAAVACERLPPTYLPAEPPEFTWVRETQRYVGTVVHAWLKRLSEQRELPLPAALAGERTGLAAELAQLGVPGAERPQAVELILAALRGALADERGRWILAASHRDAHSEWALTGMSGGQLRSVKIDRCFIDESGTRWVIDYKTSRHEGGDLEGFMAQELERYRPQLEGYVALARALGPEPVRAALYFPLLGSFRELE